MIIVVTHAYNAEKTIERAVDSILNQTYGSFRYYLIDNGSSDGTSDIIVGYAKRDNRIRALRSDTNMLEARKAGKSVSWTIKDILELSHDEYPEGRYYCKLDADDEYMPTFFEKALAFMQLHNLDIVACSSHSISEETGEKVDIDRFVLNDLILQNEGFVKHIAVYNLIMSAVWGKMYSLPIVRKWYIESAERTSIPPGTPKMDVIATTKMFSYADRVGILAEKLHRQYFSPNSLRHTIKEYHKNRHAPHIHHSVRSDFIKCKSGRISPHNSELFEYYVNYTYGSAMFLLKMEILTFNKVSALSRIIRSFVRTVSFWGLCVTLKKAFLMPWQKLIRKLRRIINSQKILTIS